MKVKKILPCLDVRNGRVVKGVRFEGLRDIDDPVALARYYNESGADELVFYDITASIEGRTLFTDLLKKIKAEVDVPLTVGGGIAAIEDVDLMIESGADKVSINSGALRNPGLLKEAADKYGSERIVFAMDVKRVGDSYHVFRAGGREDTGKDALEWARQGESLGAGEIVLNTIDTDGVRKGYDLEMLKSVAEAISIPIVASGGAGCADHFYDALMIDGVESALAASVFHSKEVNIKELKKELRSRGVPVSL
jgi:cyclase